MRHIHKILLILAVFSATTESHAPREGHQARRHAKTRSYSPTARPRNTKTVVPPSAPLLLPRTTRYEDLCAYVDELVQKIMDYQPVAATPRDRARGDRVLQLKTKLINGWFYEGTQIAYTTLVDRECEKRNFQLKNRRLSNDPLRVPHYQLKPVSGFLLELRIFLSVVAETLSLEQLSALGLQGLLQEQLIEHANQLERLRIYKIAKNTYVTIMALSPEDEALWKRECDSEKMFGDRLEDKSADFEDGLGSCRIC